MAPTSNLFISYCLLFSVVTNQINIVYQICTAVNVVSFLTMGIKISKVQLQKLIGDISSQLKILKGYFKRHILSYANNLKLIIKKILTH
jgi:hypothetical protein